MEDNEAKLRDSHENEYIECVRKLWLTRRHTRNDAERQVLMDMTCPKKKLHHEIALWLCVGKQKKVGSQDGQLNEKSSSSIIEY